MNDQAYLHRISLTVPLAAADEAVAGLAELCPEGFEEHDVADAGKGAATRFVFYAEPAEGDALHAAVESLAAELGERHGADSVLVERDRIVKENWREAWKVHFTVQHVDRFVIRPSWIDYAPTPEEHVIHLDPGSAFGTGLHATTRLCLRALLTAAGHGLAPGTVLDFGCGTGILGLGACLLWPCQVVAVDDDPLAVQACVENAERNEQIARVEAVDRLPECRLFELTLANIRRPVLLEHRDRLIRATAPGGRLILCGLLLEDREPVETAFAAAGARTLEVTTEGEWVALTMERTP